MALRQRQGGGDSERLTQAEPARQMAPPPSQYFQPGAQRQSSPAEDSRQAQSLSQNLDRVGQSVSSQAERADSQLPLTQRATEQKSREVEESARQLGADHPAESAEILKSAELAKEEFGEASKARSAGDEKKAEAHEEKAREHFDAASEKADAIAKLDSAIKELKEAGAPPELLGAMKLPSFKASAAKELSDYAKSASGDLRSATEADKAAMGPIYARGLLALKAGKRVEAGLHSELAKAYPKASRPDKGKIEGASSASAKGRMSAADVLALMSAIRTGPGGAGIPPGKIRERIMAIQARLRELSSRPELAAKLKGISALVGPALAYAAKAEEARRTGDDAKAADYDRIASNHLLEAETKLKGLEAPGEALPAAPVVGPEAPALAEKPKGLPADLMSFLKAEFAGREGALDSWLTAAGGDRDEVIGVLRDVYSMRVEGAMKEAKDPGRIAAAMTILASLAKPAVKDLEEARAFLSTPAIGPSVTKAPKPGTTEKPKTAEVPAAVTTSTIAPRPESPEERMKGPTTIEYGFAAATAPVEDPINTFIGAEIEMAGPEERKKLETIIDSLTSGKLKREEALNALGSFYKSRIEKAMKDFGKSADPLTIEAMMGSLIPLSGAPSVSDVAAGAALSGLADLLASEKDAAKRREIESLISGLSSGKIAPSSALPYISLSHKRSELAAESSRMKTDEERCGHEFAIILLDGALGKLAKGENPSREIELISSGLAMLPEMEAAFAAFGAKDAAEGRKALEEMYLALQDALAAGDSEKAKALFTAASVYAKTGIADMKDYVRDVSSRLSKNEISPDAAAFLIGITSEMAKVEDSINNSGLSLEEKGAALLNVRAYLGMSASLYEKGDRIGAAYAATLGGIYSSAVLVADSASEEWVNSVLGDFSSSESVALGKTFGSKPEAWAGAKPASESPLWLAASSDSSFSDELSKTGKTLPGLNLEIAEHKADVALAGIRSKAAGKAGAEVSHVVSLAEEGARLSKEAASLEEKAAELRTSGKEAEAKKVLGEAGSKRARGVLILRLADRILDINAAKADAPKGSGTTELDSAADLYTGLAEKLVAGEAVSADIERLPEADAALRAGLEKIAAEKALEKALKKEGAALKKAEKRHEELKTKWKGTTEASYAYHWEEVEKDLKKAAFYLKKGDLPKARLARVRASLKTEIFSEKAEITDAYVKSGGKKVYDLPKALSTLGDALGKADKGDFKGAASLLSDSRSARALGSAHLVYENIIDENLKDIATLGELDALCAAYGAPKEGEAPSKAYTDALKVVLEPLRVSVRDKKTEISKESEEAAKKRDEIKTASDLDYKKIEADDAAHAKSRKDFGRFMMGAKFAIDVGRAGAYYTDASASMGKAGPGVWDDVLASAAGEHLRLGAAIASDPAAARAAIDEGKAIHLPEIRHTVKGDEHTPDRVIAVPAGDMTIDKALKTATGRALAAGEGKSLSTWNPEMSKSAADTDAELTIAATFGLGKDSKGEYKDLHFSAGEMDYLAKLKEGMDKSKGWFLGYTLMTSPLSYDDRLEGLTAAGDLGKTIGRKSAATITSIADRGEAITDARSMSIKAKMDGEGILIDRSIKGAEVKVSDSIKSATEDERKWKFGTSVVEFATVNLVSAATGGLAAPFYYALKSGITIGEAELSGEWEAMGSGSKAMLWAGLGISVVGMGLAGTGAVIAGLGKEAVAASAVLSAADRITRIGGYGLLGGGTVMAGAEIYETIHAGGSWYEVGFLLFTNIAPHFATAAPLVIPKSKFAELGHTLGGRFATSLLTGSSPEEAEPMVWTLHEEARYKKYLGLPDPHKDAYHAVEIAIGRELSPDEGLKVIELMPDLKADSADGRAGFAKAAAEKLGIPEVKAPPEAPAAVKLPEVVPPPRTPAEAERLAKITELDFYGRAATEPAPLTKEDLGEYRKAISDEVAALKKKIGATLKAEPEKVEGGPPSYVRYAEKPPEVKPPGRDEPPPPSTGAPPPKEAPMPKEELGEYRKGMADRLGALRKRMMDKRKPPEASPTAAAETAPPPAEALPAPELKKPSLPEAAKRGLIGIEADKIREVLAKPPEKLSPDEFSVASDIRKLTATGMTDADAIKAFVERRYSGAINPEETLAFVDGTGKWAEAPLRDAPSPELGKLITMSASASVYESTIVVKGETKKVVAKVFAEPEKNLPYAKKELESLKTAASIKAKLPDGREVPLGPEPYGFAIVDGKYAIVMEHLDGGDLSHMSAAEIRDCVSPETYDNLGALWKRLTDEGHDISDFQFFVIKNDGDGRKKGDVVLLDVGSLRPRSPDTETAESRVSSAKNLVAMKLLEVEYLPEKRKGEPDYEPKLSTGELAALEKIARMGPGGSEKEPWEAVWALMRIPPKARTKAVENALKSISAGGDLAGEARIRVALRDVELKTGATLLPPGPSPSAIPAPTAPAAAASLSPGTDSFVGAMRFDDPAEGRKNLAVFARKLIRGDPAVKAEFAALPADDAAKIAIDALCNDSGFNTFAKHVDDAEFDKNWARIRSRKAAIEKALDEMLRK